MTPKKPLSFRIADAIVTTLTVAAAGALVSMFAFLAVTRFAA